MAYSKKAKTNAIYEDDKEYDYELIICDSDTAVFRSSDFVQEKYVEVTHIKSGSLKEFKNKTEFYGHWKKKEGGWLAKTNEKLIANGKPKMEVEEFQIEEHTRLIDEIEDHIAQGVKNFDFYVGSIKKFGLAPEYKLLIGGEGNYRYEVAQTLPYKGSRTEKPILFEEIREAIINKYSKYIEIVDGKEVDDQMAVWGEDNIYRKDTEGKFPYVLAYIDKDLDMIISPSVNPDKPDDDIVIPTELDCARHYCVQLLIGDKSTDNIQGLPNLEPHLREEYGVRLGNSLGKATALSYLESADSPKELFRRVVEAYIAYYGVGHFETQSHRGEVYDSSWMVMLQEVAMLVYMNPYEDPLDYHIGITLAEYEVDIVAEQDKYNE